MTGKQSCKSDTNQLLQDMMKQMMTLQEKVEAIQSSRNEVSNSRHEFDDEKEDGDRGLVQLMETMKTLLEAAFSGTITNADRKKRVEKIGITDCDQIRCPKLDRVLKAVLSRDAIKADGYLSCLQQFWLDTVAPLVAILESTEAENLTPEKAVTATQTALYLMGNAHQHASQERQHKLVLKLNPLLRFMAEDNKNFTTAAPMLFGEEFAKQATTTVEQVKAMKKLTITLEKRIFPDTTPKVITAAVGWLQERPCEILPIQRKPDRADLHPSRSKQTRTS